ncbi:hypothetical protein [Staphylococcus xylosus]|uniref:hypothetical protein n=1 Tax=Staphylococcus xylosus TaxID=1288 RepID=UPI000D1D27DA|nr:hypothetical protein [Staphylococcus xylosus]PTH98733.1 hypothetical protein BU099_07550 [Staphylococcus xylosus]
MRIIKDFIDFQNFIKSTENNSYISITSTVYWKNFDNPTSLRNIILLENGDSLKQVFYIFDKNDSINIYIPKNIDFFDGFIILKFNLNDLYIIIDINILSNYEKEYFNYYK